MKRGIIILILIVFSISLVSAIFTQGTLSHSIEESYGPEQTIKGWINISLENELANSILESSLGGSISLIDLIKKISNSGFVYNCDPLTCTSNYVTNNEETSKTFDLDEGDSVLFGFEIIKDKPVTDVSIFSFKLQSNNPETEKSPLSLDILNNGGKEWNAYSPSENFGSENFGCFIGGMFMSKAPLAQVQYCEKITLSKTPEVEIGAYVEGEGNVPFTMKIQRVGSGEYKTCSATASGSGRISCQTTNYPIKKDGDYFVCIKTADSSDINKYSIAYEENSPCGFSGIYGGEYDYDFEIFARPKKYASSINFVLNNEELEDAESSISNLEIYIEDYLDEMYDNDCSDGCIIPIKIFSGINQQIEISDAYLSYTSGIVYETENIYDIQETPAKITADFQKLYLDDAEFKVPSEYKNYTLSIDLNGEDLFSEKILVGPVPVIKSLTPTKTAINYPTKFEVEISSKENITEYNWDFGDGGVQITTKGEVTHTYESIGDYTLTIEVSDSKGKEALREFNISVRPASEIVPTLLEETKINFENIKSQISNFSQFEQQSLEYSLKFDEVKKNIMQLQDDLLEAVSEQDYEIILGKLLEIKIPKSVAKTASSSGIIFYPEEGNINLDILKKIGGGDYETDKKEGYKMSILAWNEENIETSLGYSEITSIYEDYEEPFLKVFDFVITNKGSDNPYLIIKKMENLLFEGTYSQKESDGYYYITLNDGENKISFSTTEDVDFVNLPAFISPGISKLSLAEWTPSGSEELKKWVLRWIFFSIIVVLILLIATVIWVILQIWYKRKYESYLFKNRNSLYNLVNYIEVEKRKGTDKRKIASKLKKAGWKSEQIRYVMKKYAGKRTGMFELPIGKLFGRKSNNPKGKNSQNRIP